MKLLISLFAWLVKLSPKKLARSKPGPLPCNPGPPNTAHSAAQPIEISTEEDVTLGIDVALGWQDTAAWGPNGELIRSRRNVSVACGCGHIAFQMKPGEQTVRGIAGQCAYCVEEFREALVKGEITVLEAERRSLICSDCGTVTTAGILSCPRHCVAIMGSDGQTIYLGPNEQAQLGREQTVQKILSPFLWLLSDQDQSQITEQETDDV